MLAPLALGRAACEIVMVHDRLSLVNHHLAAGWSVRRLRRPCTLLAACFAFLKSRSFFWHFGSFGGSSFSKGEESGSVASGGLFCIFCASYLGVRPTPTAALILLPLTHIEGTNGSRARGSLCVASSRERDETDGACSYSSAEDGGCCIKKSSVARHPRMCRPQNLRHLYLGANRHQVSASSASHCLQLSRLEVRAQAARAAA